MKVEEARLLNALQVSALIGVSRTTLYRMVLAKQFPRPIRIGQRATRWRLSEILEWMDSRPPATYETLQ